VDALDRDDPALVRRLAAAHLKLVPAGEIPLLIAASASQTEREWIDASLSPIRVPERRSSTSVLASLASGRARLWLLGGGFFAIFLGLVLDPFRDAVAADAGSVGAERDDPPAGGAMGCPGRSEPGSRRIAA
jgi:hypothetical protein